MINIDRSLDIFKMTSDSPHLSISYSWVTISARLLIVAGVYVKDYINRYLSNHLQAVCPVMEVRITMCSHGVSFLSQHLIIIYLIRAARAPAEIIV